MLNLYYEGVDAGIRHRIADFSGLALAGSCLVDNRGDYVAFLHNGVWRTSLRDYAVLEIASNVVLWFDDHANCSERIGPFECIRIVSGSVWAKDRVLARYDEGRDDWIRPEDEHPWPVVLIQQCSQVAAPSVLHWDVHALPQPT